MSAAHPLPKKRMVRIAGNAASGSVGAEGARTTGLLEDSDRLSPALHMLSLRLQCQRSFSTGFWDARPGGVFARALRTAPVHGRRNVQNSNRSRFANHLPIHLPILTHYRFVGFCGRGRPRSAGPLQNLAGKPATSRPLLRELLVFWRFRAFFCARCRPTTCCC